MTRVGKEQEIFQSAVIFLRLLLYKALEIKTFYKNYVDADNRF